MGTRTFSITVSGISMQEAFQEAQKEAEREKGQDIYNGNINNCTLEKDITRQYMAATDKRQFVEDILDNLEKRSAYGITLREPVKNKNKIKTVVKVTPQKGARQWATRFVIDKSFDFNQTFQLVHEDSQTAAIKKARQLAEKHQESFDINIEKYLKKGVTKVATVSYKKSSDEKEGRYLFLVAAPE